MSDPDDGAFPHVFAEPEALGREDDERGPVLKPAHFLALPEGGIAGDHVRSPMLEMQQDIEGVQVDAGDQHRRDRH